MKEQWIKFFSVLTKYWILTSSPGKSELIRGIKPGGHWTILNQTQKTLFIWEILILIIHNSSRGSLKIIKNNEFPMLMPRHLLAEVMVLGSSFETCTLLLFSIVPVFWHCNYKYQCCCCTREDHCSSHIQRSVYILPQSESRDSSVDSEECW